MREQRNVPTKNTNDPPISPVVVNVDGQERTTNWVTLLVLQCTGPGVMGGHVT